ncbi:MAG: MFS transporter [Halobacteriales archaeon]
MVVGAFRVALRGGSSRVARHDLFLGVAALWFLGKFVRYAFPPLFDTFQVQYGVSTGATGLAFSAFMVVYALMQFPSGAIADRIGSVRVIAAGAALAGLGSLWVLLEPPFLLLAGAMAVIGAGTGVHKTVAVRLLSNAYHAHLGRTLGVFDTIGAGGGVVAPVAVAAVLTAAVVAWPALFGVTAAAFGLAGAGVLLAARRRPAASAPGHDGGVLALSSYRRTFARPRVLGFVAVTVLMAFAYNGVVAFLPLYLVDEAGLSGPMASLLYSLVFVASVSQLVTGEATDRIGPLRVVSATLAVTALGLVGLLAIGSGPAWLTDTATPPVLGVAIFALGIGAHGYRPGRDVYIVSIVPAATTGGALGLVRTVLMVAGAVSPGIVGLAVDLVGFRTSFGALAVVLAAAATLAFVLAGVDRRHG